MVLYGRGEGSCMIWNSALERSDSVSQQTHSSLSPTILHLFPSRSFDFSAPL
ncbi:hypothetical protein M378DRAFT_156558, partial [Amanita muscaria Koide BX008]